MFPLKDKNIKHLMTGPEGNSEFCFPRISMFPETKLRETFRFEGNKIHCSPRDQSLSDLLYSKTKQRQNLKTALRLQWSRATAVNISWVTVNCFPFDVIVFTMLPAHGIWRETVSLLDVMWPWSSQWMGGKNASYITIFVSEEWDTCTCTCTGERGKKEIISNADKSVAVLY